MRGSFKGLTEINQNKATEKPQHSGVWQRVCVCPLLTGAGPMMVAQSSPSDTLGQDSGVAQWHWGRC